MPTGIQGAGFARETAKHRAVTEVPNPRRPLLIIVATSLVASVGLSALTIHRLYTSYLVEDAEHQAVAIGQSMLGQLRRMLVAAGGKRLLSSGPQVLSFDRRLRTFLRPFDLLKVKVYAEDRTVVYSTDPSVTGRVDRHNIRLSRALAGHNDSRLESKETVLDLAGERAIDVDVVETYLPIYGPKGRIIGAFEIYLDVTEYRQRIRAATASLVLALALILTGVLGGAFVIIRRGAARLAVAEQRLREFATTDSLTGTLTRAEILARAYEELSRLQRSAGQGTHHLSLILMDLDNLKQVNDTHGHLAGDLVLSELSRRAKQVIREYDLVGRYGGDEFLFVLPDASLDEALRAAERIRRAVADEPFKAIKRRLTVSLGVAASCGDDAVLDAIIEHADDGLYRAKREGRDRVAWVASKA